MTIADCPLFGQSASGLNFYDDSGRSLLADKKLLFRHFSLRQRDDDDAASLLNDDAQLCKCLCCTCANLSTTQELCDAPGGVCLQESGIRFSCRLKNILGLFRFV
jgi:hypothetical protein